MTTLSIEIPEQLAARLEAIAQGRHLTQAEVVREALTAFVDPMGESRTLPRRNPSSEQQLQGRPRPGSALETMGDLVGSLEGPGDLSTNPAYMEGFGES
jgi:Arc/MetJ-type ribon-helix-helix transcriptional regulator